MNIDLHSHFFPVEALQNPGKYEDRAPKIVLVDKGKLSVTSQIGFRPGLGAAAYDPAARIKALDEMKIDLQAISRSPILLFYWEDAAVAAHFSRRQNEAIQAVVRKHPDRFVGFGSVPLQSVPDAIAIAREAKAMGLKGLEIGNAVGDKPLDDPMFEPFFQAAQELDMLLFVHPLEGGLDADDPLSPILGNALQFTFRTTMMVERMILTGMFEKYPNLKLCLSHGGGLLAFNIWRLDHSYGLRADLQKQMPKKPSEYLKKLYFDTIVHSVAASSWNKEACSSSDWTTKYSDPLYLLETFVDRSRFLGTSYQAANWIYVGQSQGRTRNDSHKTIHVALKDIYLYPLTARWRELLRL